jgi:hypothetical protein
MFGIDLAQPCREPAPALRSRVRSIIANNNGQSLEQVAASLIGDDLERKARARERDGADLACAPGRG